VIRKKENDEYIRPTVTKRVKKNRSRLEGKGENIHKIDFKKEKVRFRKCIQS